MSSPENRRRWRFIEFSALDPEQAVLDNITAADAMFAAEPIELAHERQHFERFAVKLCRNAGVEADGDDGRLVGRLFGRPGQYIRFRRRRLPCIGQIAHIQADAPEIAIDLESLADRLVDRDMALAGKLQLVLLTLEVPLTHGG